MGYFDNKNVSARFLSRAQATLRNCQYGGMLAVQAHFTASSEPALVSLPTGSGKTELMFAIAFALGANRVLIVEPSRFLREQTAARLRSLEVFRTQKLVPKRLRIAQVHEVEHCMGTTEDWEALRKYDAITATPKTVSCAEKLVCEPPQDLFDCVLIDEAHHSAAKTWRSIVNTFSSAKVVMFTATAFRRDRRRLPGRLVYHYPIGRALRDEIYRPVEFLSVQRRGPENIDEDIARATADKLIHERRTSPDAALLIRTDRIANCAGLRELYAGLGIDVVEIHSKLTKFEARERLNQLRIGEVKAVVTVGMMAEGIDVPGLKLAALHAPPKSLPYTLQLVGRVSRTPRNQVGAACLVASPDQVMGEARRLFREDRDWKNFIPELVEQAIREAHGDRAQVILSEKSASSIIPELLTPFFSVQVFRYKDPLGKIHDDRLPLDLEDVVGLPRTVESIEALAEFDDGCLAVVTASNSPPKWAPGTELSDYISDLHVFYAPPETNFLFYATTSPLIGDALKNALVDETKSLDPSELNATLRGVSAYSAVGLENALGLTGAQPTYKMHLGSGAATSVKPSDGLLFGAGHAVGRLPSGEFRGIATRGRRIWAIKRKSLAEFTAWCRLLSQQITPGMGLPGLGFLSQPVPAGTRFTERPIGIIVSERQFQLPCNALVQVGERSLEADLDPTIEIKDYREGVLTAMLAFAEMENSIKLSYRAENGDENWNVDDLRNFEIVEPESGQRTALSKYLNEHPPIILMPNGGAIRGDYAWDVSKEVPKLNRDRFEAIQWDNVDIRKESRPAENGQINVQQKSLELLETRLSDQSVLIVDDGAYEIADIVAIDPQSHLIVFVHCKYSIENNAGNRIADWHELFAQCARSHSWIRREDLLNELVNRLERRQNTNLAGDMGSQADLELLAQQYRPNEWNYQVIAVQPGCSLRRLFGDANSHVYRGLAVTFEWLQQTGATFEVWGSN